MGTVTYSELTYLYLTLHLHGKSSYSFYCRLARQCFQEWNEHPTKGQLRDWHRAHEATPVHANKGLIFHSAMYNWANLEGIWTESNPAQGIRRYHTFPRDRVYINAELTVILQWAEDVYEFHPHDPIFKMAALVVLCLTTGCRPGEGRLMHHDTVDLTLGRWRKRCTKNGLPQWMPLPRQTVCYLQRLENQGPWFFPGQYGQPWSRAGTEKAWATVRASLGLVDARLQDCRTTVATRLYDQGEDELLVKACLNHYDGRPIAVYVRLQYDRLAQALQRHADGLWALVKEKSHVQPLLHDPSNAILGPECRLP